MVRFSAAVRAAEQPSGLELDVPIKPVRAVSLSGMLIVRSPNDLSGT